MIDAHGDARAAGGGDLLGGLFDRFRSLGSHPSPPAAAASAIHDCTGLPERTGNTAACPTRGPGDERDPSLQRHGGRIRTGG